MPASLAFIEIDLAHELVQNSGDDRQALGSRKTPTLDQNPNLAAQQLDGFRKVRLRAASLIIIVSRQSEQRGHD